MPQDAHHDSFEPVSKHRPSWIIGADIGTTYSSLAAIELPVDQDREVVDHSKILMVNNWPGDISPGLSPQVPTLVWYGSQQHRDREPSKDQFDDHELGELSGLIDDEYETSSFMSAEEELSEEDGDIPDTQGSAKFLWGFSVKNHLFSKREGRDLKKLISRSKLMLVPNEYTKDNRHSLRSNIDYLIEKGLIRKFGAQSDPDLRDVRDPISDFLAAFLSHGRSWLKDKSTFQDTDHVEFAFAVPSIWSAEASRVWQASIETAIQASGFGIAALQHGTIQDLFLTTEPEAAADYLLLTKNFALASSFALLVVDCGGGTVDVAAFYCSSRYPLRLEGEVVPPIGDNCGASYVNVNHDKLLLNRLRPQRRHLEAVNEQPLEGIIADLAQEFEDRVKRNVDFNRKGTVLQRLKIFGLQGDQETGVENRFDHNHMLMERQDYEIIFQPLFDRIGNLIQRQIIAALSVGVSVQNILLVGGFGASPSLRTWLKEFLKSLAKELHLPFEFALTVPTPHDCLIAVAGGAITRALDKRNGPERILLSSYGFLERIPGKEGVMDETDGKKYITIINYFAIKASYSTRNYEFDPIKLTHTFLANEEKFICEELLFVSDTIAESGYDLRHGKNNETERAFLARKRKDPGAVRRKCQLHGRLIVDMTFARDHPLCVVIGAENKKPNQRHPYYEVEYHLVPIVKNRNLRYEVRHQYLELEETGEYKVAKGGCGYASLAAAFQPGTA
ncbi:hypothetical protein B0O99DRAFT_581540 [Bisporella sp. PMI_857]|nr:hypothetical protein B0O99DRAFT_581540 [Bisporella sp. PMI_857]